ncbi:MAG: saccharopine dehydrogenase NADP-binding domain-containing protein [Pseudomonadota bacterium]
MNQHAHLEANSRKSRTGLSARTKTAMVIGGTGVMGSRLVAHLAAHSELDVVFTSRSRERAEVMARALQERYPESTIKGISLDTSRAPGRVLHDCQPFLIIDASGPFQNSDYAIPSAAIRAGAHYLDLADARGYLTEFESALDKMARDACLVARAGASSTPALSFAAVRKLAENLEHVESVDIAITPGGQSEVGRAVVEAVLSYAGRPTPIWQNGRPEHRAGWSGATYLDVPGLGDRRVALVETIDAQLIGERLDVHGRVAFYAGLQSKIEQLGMEGLGWLVQKGLPLPTRSLAPLLHRVRSLTRFGMSDEGGMVVKISGRDKNGRVCDRQWSLLARQGHGPVVPIMAAAALAKKLARDQLTPGAGLACDVLLLEEIEAEMAPYAISTNIS